MATPFKLKSGNATPFKMMGSSSPLDLVCGPGDTKCADFKIRGQGKKKVKEFVRKTGKKIKNIFTADPSKKRIKEKIKQEKSTTTRRRKTKGSYTSSRDLDIYGAGGSHEGQADPTVVSQAQKDKRTKDLASLEKGVVPKDMYSGKRDNVVTDETTASTKFRSPAKTHTKDADGKPIVHKKNTSIKGDIMTNTETGDTYNLKTGKTTKNRKPKNTRVLAKWNAKHVKMDKDIE